MNKKVIVALSDWCPACLEYKIILNQLITNNRIGIDVFQPEEIDLPVDVIPTTFFIVNNHLTKVTKGLVEYNQFLLIYNSLS